ncbi:unnamed protein product [marine sediment metagenome]|uniref:Uncharacterized protein n=1 Tax=marine sediment metagenome TaxID=412755 RepID=X1JFE5_9ZZZZ
MFKPLPESKLKSSNLWPNPNTAFFTVLYEKLPICVLNRFVFLVVIDVVV